MIDLTALKTYAALVGSICTALLAVWAADSDIGKVLVVVSIIATTVTTYAVPKTLHPEEYVGEHRA